MMALIKEDKRKKYRRCAICGTIINNNKTNIGEYCTEHDPKLAWNRLNMRFNRKIDKNLLMDWERINFNMLYELNSMIKLLRLLNTKNQEKNQDNLKFINEKLGMLLGSVDERIEQIKEIRGNLG